MPNVRIVNWNIQTLGPTKVAVPGMMVALGRGVAQTQADVALILEVSAGTAQATMTALSAQANAASVAAGGGANDYTGWLLSYPTGGECYGVLFRDLNVVRPVQVTGGPTGAATPTDPNDPADPDAALNNLERNTFVTWPGTFAAMANAYAAPLPAPAARPELPLTDVFATTAPTGRKRARFSGRSLAYGGYALGRGFRMPCLTILSVLNAGGGGPPHIIPVMVCHLGAVRGGANPLARQQIEQYKDTDIAQRFQAGDYIDLDGAAVAIQELVITGDFNVDFLQNAAVGNALQTGNRAALNAVTPTVAVGGSGAPAALPGAPGPAPMVPFAGPFADGPVNTTIPNLALKTAATGGGTILKFPGVGPGPPPYVTACFDNFFYGGTQLSATVQTLTPAPPANDACLVYDVPGQVSQAAGPPGFNLGAAWLHYGALPPDANGNYPLKTQWTALAPNLDPALAPPLPPLTPMDRLVGAHYMSDHLPTIIQANLP